MRKSSTNVISSETSLKQLESEFKLTKEITTHLDGNSTIGKLKVFLYVSKSVKRMLMLIKSLLSGESTARRDLFLSQKLQLKLKLN